MALIRIFNSKDLQKLVDKKIITPDTHLVIVRYNTFYFTPIVTSRHKHYVILRASRQEGTQVFKDLYKQGFTLVKGSIRILFKGD